MVHTTCFFSIGGVLLPFCKATGQKLNLSIRAIVTRTSSQHCFPRSDHCVRGDGREIKLSIFCYNITTTKHYAGRQNITKIHGGDAPSMSVVVAPMPKEKEAVLLEKDVTTIPLCGVLQGEQHCSSTQQFPVLDVDQRRPTT